MTEAKMKVREPGPTMFFRSLTAIALATTSVGCSPVSFEQGPLTSLNGSYSNFFKLNVSEMVIDQPQLDANKTSVVFQILDANGNQVQGLTSSDLEITENGATVPPFKLDSNSKKIVQTVDIVLAVDITGSMEPTIESAKMRLIDFVQKSRKNGIHSRMCLVTFGDRTVRKCDRFYDNDPSDPKTEGQARELVSEISKLKAIVGFDDPGGSDYNENPMRALIDASKAPWLASSQHFVILITDDGFLYTPGNQGSVGSIAPRYPDVLQAIADSQLKVFAATPSLEGYEKPFSGLPGIVAASGGEWFNFSGLISGKITLDTILDRIIDRVQTTYAVEYTINENTKLDPTLPLEKRKIEIKSTARSANGQPYTVLVQAVQSNLPNGRKGYGKRWKISEKSVRRDSVFVRINGKRVDGGYTVTDDGEIDFDSPPPPNAKIVIRYRCNTIRDDIQIEPIILSANTDLESIRVHLNGIESNEFEVVRTLESNYSIRLKDTVFGEEDRFGIRVSGGLTIAIDSLSLN